MNLYSDAFIVENAFQPNSNRMPFDLSMKPMKPLDMAKKAKSAADGAPAEIP